MMTALLSLLPYALPVSIAPAVQPGVAATLSQSGSASSQGVARVYDLSHIDWAPVQERDALATTLVPGLNFNDHETKRGTEDDLASPGARVVSIIQALLGDEFEYEGRRFEETQSGRMLVVGPQGLHQRITVLLGFLERIASSHVELSVDVLTLPAGKDMPAIGSIVPGEQADRWMGELAGRGGARASYQMHVRATGPSVLKLTQDLNAILDYDVEIAQGATIGDPVEHVFAVGTRFAVRAAPSASGVHLAMTLKRGELMDGPKRKLQTGFLISTEDGKPAFFDDLLHVTDVMVMNRSVSLATHIPTGHAMILETGASLERGGMREYLVLRQSGGSLTVSDSLDLGNSGAALFFADLGALVPPTCTHAGQMMWPGLVMTTLDRSLWQSPLLSAGLRRPETSTFVSFLEGASGDSISVDVQGDWLIARPHSGAGRAGRDLGQLRAHFDQLLAPAETLDVRIQLDQAGRPAVVARVPIRAGTSAGVAIGIEDFEQPSYDVEVAQFAATDDPQVNSAFDGLVMFIQPTVESGGNLALTLRGSGHLLLGRESIDLGGRVAGQIDHSEYAHLFVNETLSLQADGDGAWSAVLGRQGEGATKADLTLRVDISR